MPPTQLNCRLVTSIWFHFLTGSQLLSPVCLVEGANWHELQVQGWQAFSIFDSCLLSYFHSGSDKLSSTPSTLRVHTLGNHSLASGTPCAHTLTKLERLVSMLEPPRRY